MRLIDAYQSIGEIQGALGKNGARQVMLQYNDEGFPSGIIFVLESNI